MARLRGVLSSQRLLDHEGSVRAWSGGVPGGGFSSCCDVSSSGRLAQGAGAGSRRLQYQGPSVEHARAARLLATRQQPLESTRATAVTARETAAPSTHHWRREQPLQRHADSQRSRVAQLPVVERRQRRLCRALGAWTLAKACRNASAVLRPARGRKRALRHFRLRWLLRPLRLLDLRLDLPPSRLQAAVVSSFVPTPPLSLDARRSPTSLQASTSALSHRRMWS